jgi:hypothetical protein
MKTAKARPWKLAVKIVPSEVILQVYGRMITIDFPLYDDKNKGEVTDEYR